MLRFVESFDDGLYNLGKWDTFTGAAAIDTGRHSSNGLRIRDFGNFDGRIAYPATDHIIVGIAVNWQVVSSSDEIFLRFYEEGSSTNEHVVISTQGTSGDLRVYRGNSAVLLATAAGAVTTDGFHYIEVELVIDDTVGSVVVRKDAVEIINETGLDTRDAGAGPNTDVVRIGGNTSSSTTSLQTIIDDIYIADDAAGEVDAMLGDMEVHALFPDGDGDTTDWTPDTGSTNYTQVDETTPDDDTSYVETTIASDLDVYTMDDLSDAGIVYGVVAYGYVKNPGGGTLNVKHAIRRSSTNQTGTSIALPTAYGVVSEVFETDPHTGSAWTRTNLNNSQFGLEAQ